MKTAHIIIILTLGLVSAKSQSSKPFKGDFYPLELIDSTISQKRNLQGVIENFHSCNWKNRVGKKVDVFWLKTDRGDYFGHVYEYFMDCDNLRLIYWSLNGRDIFPIIDFMIEDLEDDSQFVTSPRKHLKNKKKYKQYLLGSKKR